MDAQKNTMTPVGAPPSTKRPRLPRYQRAKNPPAMVLMERDQAILRAVQQFRLITREQVEQLLFLPEHGQAHLTKTSKVRERLKLLFHHGYLERMPTPVAPGAWAWRPVYRLGRKGAELLSQTQEVEASPLAYWGKGDDKDHRKSAPSLLFLTHTLAINDVRIAVLLAAKAQGYTVDRWLDDTTLKSAEMKEYVLVSPNDRHKLRVPVIPDAYFILNLGNRRAHFFLELDRATMTTERWKTRVLAYQEFIRSGRYQERYGTRSLRILTVTTTPQRLESLRNTTQKVNGGDLFWFTPIDQATPATILSAPIWSLADGAPAASERILIG